MQPACTTWVVLCIISSTQVDTVLNSLEYVVIAIVVCLVYPVHSSCIHIYIYKQVVCDSFRQKLCAVVYPAFIFTVVVILLNIQNRQQWLIHAQYKIRFLVDMNIWPAHFYSSCNINICEHAVYSFHGILKWYCNILSRRYSKTSLKMQYSMLCLREASPVLCNYCNNLDPVLCQYMHLKACCRIKL
jgi:hypothetical protein